jgi:antitoxin component HigA of HigAB toxin-antitoxin module
MFNLDNIKPCIRNVETTSYGVKFLYQSFPDDYDIIEHYIQLVRRTDEKIDIQIMSDNKAIQKCIDNHTQLTVTVIDKLISVFELI